MKINSVTSAYYPSSDFESAIVVPCYKEEKRINIPMYMDSLGTHSSRVFLVDDGSPDKTFSVLKNLEKSAPDRFIAIKCPENMGKAEAVRRGMNEAIDRKFKYIGFLDADLAVKFNEVPRFLKIFQDVPEVTTVIGTRTRLAGHKVERNLPKYLVQRVIAEMGSHLFGKKVEDTQCGSKMFDAKVLSPTLKEKFSSRWLFDQELLARISRLPESQNKNWLFELPVTSWVDVAGTHRKPSDYLKCLKDYFKLVKKYGFKR